MGLRTGLVEALADAGAEGLDPRALAEHLGFDPFYVGVWCRSALAAGICERDGDRFRLAPHMATLLLDTQSPAYAASAEWIAGVAGTGTPFYTRLVPGGLDQIPDLPERLAQGCRVVDTACGAGTGLVRLARTYPSCRIVGVDGDEHSLSLAEQAVDEAGVADRVELVESPLEEMDLAERATLVINNISMHECRDIDRVTANVADALEPGGWFVISDFPFPDSTEGLRTVPGRIMAGIQFFEAQIDDQLLPRRAYDDLLERHDFHELGSVELAPVHALTWGRIPD